MSIANYVPQIWSARLLANLDKALLLANSPTINQNWEGEIRDVGDRVRIQRPGDITVGAYTKGTPINYETPTSTTRTLVINQDQYYAFTIDDLDQVQSNVNLIDTYTRRAAYSLALTLDTHIAGLYTEQAAGDVAVNLVTTTDNMYEKVVEAGENLDLKNVPRMGRWLVVSPKGYARLLKTEEFIKASDLGDAVVQSGVVGRVAGFDIYMSNNLAAPSGTTKAFLYGTSDAITHARQLLGNPEAVRREGVFEDALRGRIAYGSLVVEPDALGTITATES